DAAVAVLDRRVVHPAAAGRVDVVLVPASQRPGVTKRESLEERRVAVDVAGHGGHRRLMPSQIELVRALGEITLVDDVAFERARAGAQLHLRVRLLGDLAGSFPPLAEVDRAYHGVRRVRSGGRCDRLQFGDADTRGKT